MFQNYLKIAWRNLMKSKTFSFINIFGLSAGLACCLLIAIYLNHETSYDSYHKNISDLYQLGTTFVKDGKEERTPNTPAPMSQAMKNEFPEIREAGRIMPLFAEDKTLLQYKPDGSEPKSFYESRGFMADNSIFNILTYNFIEGNSANALTAPNTLVINEEIAHKIFGNESAINKVIHMNSNSNGEHDFRVTGVFRPSAKPSQLDARFFVSVLGGDIEGFLRQQTDMASNNMFHTFFLLKEGASAKNLQAKFPAFVDKYIGKDLKAMGFYKKQFLVPVRDMHLRAGMPNDITPVGSITYLYILGSIALFTLIIACINFMNLSTARSSKRSAEVGVRKVLGAERKSLISQFLGESIMLSIIAFFISMAITLLLLPAFSQVSGKNLTLDFSKQLYIAAGFFLLSLIAGILAGIYPAFYLSSFQPVKVLKGRFNNSLAAVALRKGLVVFQFIISVILIVASVVISNQMKFIRSTDLGFARDQQIIIPLRSSNAKNIYDALKTSIRKNPLAIQVGASMAYPGIVNPSDMGVHTEGKTANDAKLIHTNWVDPSFLQTLDIKLIAGRMFSEEFPGDTSWRIVINEEAVKQLNFPSAEKAVGNKLYFDWKNESYTLHIVGVVKDFHFQDLHVPIAPYGFFLNNTSNYNYMVAHTKAKDLSAMLKYISASWKSLNPGEPFEYSFLDEDFQRNYEGEDRLAAIVGYFTGIAILISCLGLFGLATFSAEQRTKEIGVRKVLGASIPGIVTLLSKDFLKLVAVSIVIASPVAWFVMNKWLQDFAYRTSIGWQVFVITTITALMIALITISFQAIRAALMNPVKSLRTE